MSLSVALEWTISSSPWQKIEKLIRLKIKKILVAFFGLKGLIDHEFFPSKPWLEPYWRNNCSAVPSRSSFSEKVPKLSSGTCLCTTNFALSRGTDYQWAHGKAQHLTVSPSALLAISGPLRFPSLSRPKITLKGKTFNTSRRCKRILHGNEGQSAKCLQHLHWKLE